MSALAGWEPASAGVPASRRGRLHLVAPVPVPRGHASRVRRTRAGTVVAVALTTVALAVVLSLVVGPVFGSSAPATRTITVAPGQTLSHIAAAEYPGLPIRDGVVQLQLANGLNSPQVRVGQQLVVPALP